MRYEDLTPAQKIRVLEYALCGCNLVLHSWKRIMLTSADISLAELNRHQALQAAQVTYLSEAEIAGHTKTFIDSGFIDIIPGLKEES